MCLVSKIRCDICNQPNVGGLLIEKYMYEYNPIAQVYVNSNAAYVFTVCD